MELKKGAPRRAFSLRSLTRMKVCLMQMPWLQIWAFDSLYLIISFLPLAPKRVCLVFSYSWVGTRPFCRQFKAAPKSIKAIISRINLFLITIVRETSHLWKITLLIVFKYEFILSLLSCEDSRTSSKSSFLGLLW